MRWRGKTAERGFRQEAVARVEWKRGSSDLGGCKEAWSLAWQREKGGGKRERVRCLGQNNDLGPCVRALLPCAAL